MKRFQKVSVLAVILILSIVPFVCFAGERPDATLEKAVDAIMARQNVTSKTPGCAIAIIRDGKIILEKGYGLANLDYSIPITPRTVFNIGSISKQFTASAIYLLAEEERLSLDDDIHTFFPDFPDYGHPITVRHLLHHVSGVRDYEALMVPANMPYDRNYSPDELYAFITRQRELNFTPGDEFSYSNSGYVLLAMIVRKVSGMSLGEFDKKRIFGPLDMKDTFFYEKMHVPVKNRAIGYDKSGDSLVTGLYDVYTVGASNLYTTVEDLARWDANFYNDKVGGHGFLENLQTRGILNSGETIGYASGLNIGEYRGLRTVWHNGWWAGFGSSMMRFPDQRFTIICLSNTTVFNPYDLPYEIADICLSGMMKAAPPVTVRKAGTTVKKQSLDDRAGRYKMDNGQIISITAGENKLNIQSKGGWSTGYMPVNDRIFISESATDSITFSMDEKGMAIGLVWSHDGHASQGTKFTLSPDNAGIIANLAGDYSSDELRVTYTLSADGDKLVLKTPITYDFVGYHFLAAENPLIQFDATSFGTSELTVDFTKENGKAKGFVLGIPSVKLRIDFTRK